MIQSNNLWSIVAAGMLTIRDIEVCCKSLPKQERLYTARPYKYGSTETFFLSRYLFKIQKNKN